MGKNIWLVSYYKKQLINSFFELYSEDQITSWSMFLFYFDQSSRWRVPYWMVVRSCISLWPVLLPAGQLVPSQCLPTENHSWGKDHVLHKVHATIWSSWLILCYIFSLFSSSIAEAQYLQLNMWNNVLFTLQSQYSTFPTLLHSVPLCPHLEMVTPSTCSQWFDQEFQDGHYK